MRTQTALKLPTITNQEILNLIAQREALDVLKKRLERIQESIKGIEASMIARIEEGARVDSDHALQVKEMARRYPHWREHYIELTSVETAERILESTPPTITKLLIVK